ncbi:Spo0B domain-containing protein [Desulforamulus aquiferis]|uniref:Spo0B domain-containing protein n=1 Tax=Desulforamulus aquiferis TaxID=1397668 RepID=A0AAW7Z9Z0_9FIRM|nr:Spo0B domain-containing protein [Desulforamulus aquiferis]MDO7786243.1 Spo0B domain-containing protein [Desulforamulus aquiferis]RYD01751.1 hypothetical protein N752_28255 [Desulforamulus aquiferis]
MKTDSLLEVIQVQRHDFLNHLQVISGLLQLNKGERVRDYIIKVCGDYEKLSRITRLKSPDIKAVLLIAANEAAKKQVELVYDIQSDLSSLGVSSEIAGSALERSINHGLKYLTPMDIHERVMKLTISESERKVSFKLCFSVLSSEVTQDIKEQMDLSHWLEPYNSSSKLAVTEKEAEIYLIFPKKQSEERPTGK